jgi:superfamily II DNA or RNA helicase
MILRKHQQRILDENPDRAILCWSMRTGKSLPASIWLKQRGDNGIVVCPKGNKKDWLDMCPFATVYTKEEFKKHWKEIKKPTALVIDEAHYFYSKLFTKGRSQLATAMYNFLRNNPNLPVWQLTATPIRNDPSSLHTALCFHGKYIDWNAWRNRFYTLEMKPYLKFPAYFPKKGWQKDIRTVLEKYADIVSLKDCVDYLPPEINEIVKVKSPKFIKDIDYHWTKEHLNEQTNKIEYIRKLGYAKVIISCHYTAQIDELQKTLSKDREVFVLDGRTKNHDEVKRQAQESPECYLIVQGSMGFGFNGYMFDCLVFTSMSHKSLDHTQMRGRLVNVDDPKPMLYYYLIGGKWDKRIYDTILANEDFNPHKYEDARTTTSIA